MLPTQVTDVLARSEDFTMRNTLSMVSVLCLLSCSSKAYRGPIANEAASLLGRPPSSCDVDRADPSLGRLKGCLRREIDVILFTWTAEDGRTIAAGREWRVDSGRADSVFTSQREWLIGRLGAPTSECIAHDTAWEIRDLRWQVEGFHWAVVLHQPVIDLGSSPLVRVVVQEGLSDCKNRFPVPLRR